MRRLSAPLVTMLALLVAGLVGAARPAVAQEATPAVAPALAGMDLPELRLVATSDGIELPPQIEAGRYLVILENRSSLDVEATFVLPPTGTTPEQIQATPEADGMPPAWYYEATIAGGVVDPGPAGQVVIDLAPAGEWLIDVFRGSDETGEEHTDLLPLSVTGEATPDAEAEPAADVSVEMQDFDFAMPAQVPAGPNLWRVANTGSQPHHLAIMQSAQTVTEAQVSEFLSGEFGMAPEGATPSAGLPTWEDLTDAAYVGVLSTGRTAWATLDLEPGTYVAVCFVPDPETGMPHAAMGMVAVFTVGDGDAAEATPNA